MEIKIKKIDVNQHSMNAYITGTSVLRRTSLNSSIRFGKIVVTADADHDGQLRLII